MANRWTQNLTEKDITPESDFLNRRQVVKSLAGVGLAGLGLAAGTSSLLANGSDITNTWEEITSYNNYYEFGTGKNDPLRYAHQLKTTPWSIVIDGLVERPARYALEDIVGKMTVEERIYRLRCVEGW